MFIYMLTRNVVYQKLQILCFCMQYCRKIIKKRKIWKKIGFDVYILLS